MSDYTTRDILHMVEANTGASRLDLSREDLSFVDLGREAIQEELDRVHQENPEAEPAWWNPIAESLDLQGADLAGANLGGANLEGAFLGSVNLEEAFLGGANLEAAYLGEANLEGAFLGGANLEGAFLWHASLRRLDLRDTKCVRGVFLYRAVLDQTQLVKAQLRAGIGEELEERWTDAKETYLALKHNFNQIGRYDDASWAYRKERRMEKREAWAEARGALKKGRSGRFVGRTWKVGWDVVVECLCDYGESVGRVLGWMAFVLFVAGPLLFGFPGLLHWPAENLDAFLSRPALQRYGYAYLQHFLYALDAFTTASFAELQPASVVTRVLSGVTALIGVFLTGLLGFVAGNRIRRS